MGGEGSVVFLFCKMILRPYIQYVFGKKEDTEPWRYFELLEDYLIDQDDGLKKL